MLSLCAWRNCLRGQAHLKHPFSCTFLPPWMAFLLPSSPLLSLCQGVESSFLPSRDVGPQALSRRHESNGAKPFRNSSRPVSVSLRSQPALLAFIRISLEHTGLPAAFRRLLMDQGWEMTQLVRTSAPCPGRAVLVAGADAQCDQAGPGEASRTGLALNWA